MRKVGPTPATAVTRAAAILVLSLFGGIGCERPAAPTPSNTRSNVLLISIDTLRADRLGAYGYDVETSPNLDRLAKRSRVFERAYAQSHHTLVSHASLFTSLYPMSHRATPSRKLAASFRTLAEVLRDNGYATAAFATNPGWFSVDSGMAQGFDVFDSRWRNAERNNALIFDWLEDAREPWLLFAHYYDAHSDWGDVPYETKPPHDRLLPADSGDGRHCLDGDCGTRFLQALNQVDQGPDRKLVEAISQQYDAGVAYVDDQVGRLLAEIDRRGLAERTIIVVTSDHGEEFAEHGRFLHGQLYEEVARIPLLVALPTDTSTVRDDRVVGSIDVAPTIFDALGIESEPTDGISLLDESDRDADRLVFSTRFGGSGYRDIFVRGTGLSARVSDRFSQTELFDTTADRGELIDISTRRPAHRDRLRAAAQAFYEEQAESRDEPRTAAPAAEDLELAPGVSDRLKALGYATE